MNVAMSGASFERLAAAIAMMWAWPPLCSGSAVENSVIAAWILPPMRSGISAPPLR